MLTIGRVVLATGVVLLGLSVLTAQIAEPVRAAKTVESRLHQSARTGNIALLRSELQNGADPNALNSDGEAPLIAAVRTGHLGAVRILLAGGADVNLRSSAGRTALIEAAEAGRLRTAQLLIQHGADLNASARTGTALETAERTGHLRLAALLRRAGARTSGRSVGDTVCVRPWAGDGYCGVVEDIWKNTYRLRVTEIVGCTGGCPARAECSAQMPVGGTSGIKAGDHVETQSWCLTHTGVQR